MEFIFKSAKSRNVFWPICLCAALLLAWAANLSAQEKNQTSSKPKIQVEMGAGIGGITFPFIARFSAGVSLKRLGIELSWMKIFPELEDLVCLFSADIHMNLIPKSAKKSINPFFFLGILASSGGALMDFGGGIKVRITGNFGARVELRLLTGVSSEGGVFPLWFAGAYYRF